MLMISTADGVYEWKVGDYLRLSDANMNDKALILASGEELEFLLAAMQNTHEGNEV